MKNPIIARVLGTQILRHRMGIGVSQLEMSVRVGTSQPHINQIESGKHIPSIDLLKRICDVFEIAPSDLLREVGL